MSKPAGKCLFCGKGGLTKGHIWPDWFNDILPKTASHHQIETGKFYTFEPTVPGPDYSIETKQGHARTRKPRNTCTRCNSGWMSIIENVAKPYAVPLILNRSVILNSFGRFTVASLLVLIAMRLEALGNMQAILLEDRDWLRRYFEPTLDWKIWIAQYGGEKQDDNWARSYGAQIDSIPTDKVGPEYCNVKVTTLVIGQFCAHLFYSPVIDFAGYEGITLCRLWPPSRFDVNTAWLPVMSDQHVLWLHEAFARESPPMPHRT